ncbi:MAG TPA: DCC1-like thiol-disulfide oxidoreductase family protein [Gemmatimonadaceae bacterium]
MSDRSALLLYDGSCGFCARSVQFVLRHESRRRTLRFAPLDSPIGAEVRGRHPAIEGVDSVVWVEAPEAGDAELVLVRSAAVLRVLRYLGGVWRGLAGLAAIVPRSLADVVYDFIARHRHKLTRGNPACLLPTPEQRERFIESSQESVASR